MAADRARGRPLKGRSKRVRITLWAEAATVEQIDRVVEQRDADGRNCSRSDVYEEAATKYLEELGETETSQPVEPR